VFSNAAKNTRSSARGLFQIVDDTWDRFGGDSKLRNDIDENIRVGIKIIAANRDSYLKKYGVEPNKKEVYGLHFFGPLAFKIFNSDKDKPVKDIVPNDVLEANPFLKKMKQAEVMNFLQTKMAKPLAGAPKPTTVADNSAPVPMPQTPKETMQQSPTKVTSPRIADLPKEVTSAPMDRTMLAELGANYQAALGAISLADSAEDEEEDELLVEKYAERFGDQTMDLPVPNALANVNLSYASPFEEPAPVQMSKGGDPSIPFPTDMSFDDIPEMPPNPTPEQEAEFLRQVEEMDSRAYWKRRGPNSADELNYSPSRKMLDEFKSNMPTEGNVGVQKMAFGGIPYKPSAMISSDVKNQLSSAQSEWDAYNKSANEYNDRLNQYNDRLNQYNDQINQYNESFVRNNDIFMPYTLETFTTKKGRQKITNQLYTPGTSAAKFLFTNRDKYQTFNPSELNKSFSIYGAEEPNTFYIRTGDNRTMAAPSRPGGDPGSGPAAPSRSQESVQAMVDQAKAHQKRLQLTYDVMQDPSKYNLSMPAIFANGGEVLPELGDSASKDMQDYLNSSVSGNKDVLQGMVGGQAAEGLDARLIGTYMQSLPPKFAQQFLLNLELAKKAGVNLNKEGVANIYANIANGDTNYQIGYSPAQKSVNLSRMDGNSGIGLNIGKDNVGLNYASRFSEGGVADRANQPITTPDGYEITPSFGDRMGANVSDFVVNVGTKAASLFPVDETKMSAAHRLYLDTFGIKENRAPVTKDYFNQEEMDALADLVIRKGGKKGSITYNDYKDLMGNRPVKSYPLTSGRLDPYVSISKSLGQFNYEYDPKTGSYKILDQYDFNPKPIRGGISSDSNFIGDYIGDEQASLMDKLRIYAGRKLPPGTGRQVDLSVPAPRKRAGGSPIYGEIADTGGITPDTRAALTNYEDFKNFSPREAFDMFNKIGKETNANSESLMRGSASATLGAAGDIGQEFDIRGLRSLPSSKQLRAMFPQRITQPTKEDEGFTNVGEFIPFVSPSFVKNTAQTMMNSFKKAAPTGPTTDQLSRALFGNSTTVQSRAAEDTLRDMQRLNDHLDGARVSSPVVQAVTPAARSADQLFVGRVDEFLANQKNPVTKEQLIGQLKGKFRDYEIARVEEALADLPAASKLQPADLLARVKSKYPVDNFRTSIIEPKPGVTYNDVDNVYKKDVGIINLTLPVADATRKAADDAMLTLNSLNNFGNGRFDPPQIGQITTYLKENGLSSDYKELLNSFKLVENSPELKKVTAAKETLLDVGRAILYPDLHSKIPEVTAKLKKQYPNTYLGELIPERDMELAKIGLKELTALSSDPQFKSLQPIVSQLKRTIDSGKDIRKSDIIGKINVEISLLDQQFKPVIDKVVSRTAKDEYVKLGNELQKKRIYEGQHASITVKENPVAFSRFVDKEAAIPGMGNTKVMHIIELQSDLFDDIVKKGSKAGSKEKDLAEVVNLDKKAFQIEHSGPFQKEAVDKLKTISSKHYPRPAEKSEAYKEILGRYPDLKTQLIDYIKLTDRSSKLKARAGIGNYNRDEAFAGMEKSPQVLQQLMIKNSIGAAMQRGVNAITFPGKESEQAQLYEKLGPNLKQVVKDLGKGFEIRPIEMYDDLGNAYMHEGLVWSKDTAARVLKEGIRFNKGGAVDKNNLDYAKYI
jgi:hypothetical protein